MSRQDHPKTLLSKVKIEDLPSSLLVQSADRVGPRLELLVRHLVALLFVHETGD